ncbi:MAG: putative Glycosyltransferase [Candidatus Angelobacter sp.]|jgi:teichuronic acid biosynthesis glycosyltransferase TuaC|nr:putative Glycosyltransferase [Candidatus Angelobacter sp.]
MISDAGPGTGTNSGKPIRVLYVIPAAPSKSSMIFARRQVTSLEQAGVTCQTFLLASRTSPRILIKEWRRIREGIRSFRPDLIHAHYGVITAMFSALAARIPLVITYRGSDLNPDPGVSFVSSSARKLISQIAALRASRIICVSEELKNRLWWKRDCATVVPTGVDTSIFFPRPRNEARAQLGWDNTEPVALFNATGHHKVKRPDLAQAAIQLARNFGVNIKLVVLDGETAPETVPLMMCAADCLILTSQREGSPTVVQEAIACNLPVVAVDVGDVRTRLTGLSPSRIVDRHPDQIGKAVVEILAQAQRSNGASRVREFSHAATAERIIAIYRAALNDRQSSLLGITSIDTSSTATTS